MKLFKTILLACLCIGRLHAFDSAEVSAVCKRFDDPSGDEQYLARMELNRLVAEATIPGKGDCGAVTKVLVAVVSSPATSTEGRKYLIRALARAGTADAVEPLITILNAGDPLLREEARQALSAIPAPEAVAALEAALRESTEKREKAGLIDALALQKSPTSVPVIAPMLVDADPDIAGAALSAVARIGGPSGVATLTAALAGGSLPVALRADAEHALLIASPGDARIAEELFHNTASDAVRLAAFLALTNCAETGAKPELVRGALKSTDPAVRCAALPLAMEMDLPGFSPAASMEQALNLEERLVVLANLHRLRQADVAEKVALSRLDSPEEDERAAAIAALGRMGAKGAFDAVLQAVAAREPRINQAAAAALAGMPYPEAETALTAMLKGASAPDRMLAVKAVAFRQVPEGNAILMEIIKGSDEAASKEAMKTLYFSATLDDLRELCREAAGTGDAKLRPSLVSICSRIAGRINTDEARELVKPLK